MSALTYATASTDTPRTIRARLIVSAAATMAPIEWGEYHQRRARRNNGTPRQTAFSHSRQIRVPRASVDAGRYAAFTHRRHHNRPRNRGAATRRRVSTDDRLRRRKRSKRFESRRNARNSAPSSVSHPTLTFDLVCSLALAFTTHCHTLHRTSRDQTASHRFVAHPLPRRRIAPHALSTDDEKVILIELIRRQRSASSDSKSVPESSRRSHNSDEELDRYGLYKLAKEKMSKQFSNTKQTNRQTQRESRRVESSRPLVSH